MSNTVHVQNIASTTSEKEVRDFFSFCGKITSLELKPEAADAPKSATVTFEKETAAKTALLLDNTQLGPSQVHVTSSGTATSETPSATGAASGNDEISQEDKPRSRILAEYLAHGYAISDNAISKAIALDQQHGFSSRFTSTLGAFDEKYQASAKAKQIDEKYSLSEKANQGWLGLNSYFEKAIGTKTGAKLHSFYLESSKQVQEVHNEARRLANLKQGKQSPHGFDGTDKTVCDCAADGGKCGCAPGKCGCASCSKATPATISEVKEAAGSTAADPTPSA
ncbi:putative actin cytoskeleton protein [Phaeomoniella chlamydospora]|uniref:Putative actin cytoskeleton protein n=1 Tax=Phaeomoniella chlamydospora TaxID=158046 RepID=A0A0G2EYH8_PHACM|nr:putative actin cytoskeleton protein [Phaeomoniella chlamydospora]